MKKIFILVLMALVGFSLLSSSNLKADEARVINHKFRAITADTIGLAAGTIFRITGIASSSNSSFCIYDSATLSAADNNTVAVEGGEATSGDALPMYDFGENGLSLSTGISVDITSCVVVLEYL